MRHGWKTTTCLLILFELSVRCFKPLAVHGPYESKTDRWQRFHRRFSHDVRRQRNSTFSFRFLSKWHFVASCVRNKSYCLYNITCKFIKTAIKKTNSTYIISYESRLQSAPEMVLQIDFVTPCPPRSRFYDFMTVKTADESNERI